MVKIHKKFQKSIVKVSNGFLKLTYSIQINLINLGTGYQMGTHFYSTLVFFFEIRKLINDY